MEIRKLCIPAAIIFVASSTIVTAQEGQRRGPPAPPAFSDVDTSGDGVISREELDAWSVAAREGRTQRGDGGEGRPAAMGGAGGRGGGDLFSRIDSDGDGSISEVEFTAMLDNMRARTGEGNRPGRPEAPAGPQG